MSLPPLPVPLNIAGCQYLDQSSHSFAISGIPGGYTYSGSEMPEGWTVDVAGAIVAGVQEISYNVGIGSGTLLITYGNGTNEIIAMLDVYVNATRMGEEIMRVGNLLPLPPFKNIPLDPPCDPCDNSVCPYVMDVFADLSDPTNPLHNDKSDFYGLKYMGSIGISNIVLTLQKNVSYGGCNWVDKVIFAGTGDSESGPVNPYGSFFQYGGAPNFSGNAYVDDYGNQYTGLLLSWIKILQTFGAGQYRMKITYTSALDGSTVVDYDQRMFCLHAWDCHRTDGTVRIETTTIGFRGTMDDSTIQIDHFTGWYSQIRFSGKFKYQPSGYVKEYNQYGDGDFNAFRPIINEQVPKYRLQLKPVPGWVDWYMSTNVLQADKILITDFNRLNRHTFVQTPVSNDGDMEIVNEEYRNPYAVLEFKFTYGQNNLRKRNSG